MTFDPQQLRLDGIYQQAGDDRWMQRIKIPGGVLSSEQAEKIAEIASKYAGGRLHLTTRGSVELHDLRRHDLREVQRQLATVGLTGRGACGGAVRGIACGSSFGPNFASCQSLARRLTRHFTGNPWFEGLPKKFKIGILGSGDGKRHLIQDVGLVHAGIKDGRPLWDVWCGGGLGREPQAALLLAGRVPEERIIPLIEGILHVYRQGVEKGKRLKHLIRQVGEEEFRNRLRRFTPEPYAPVANSGFGTTLSLQTDEEPLRVQVFAGELPATSLIRLARLARDYTGGCLVLDGEQDILLLPTSEKNRAALQQRLVLAGLGESLTAPAPCFRVCPGSHDCRMGLAPTRDIARDILAGLPATATGTSLAISGCPNACSQPQLADYGIITRRLTKDEQGRRIPLFDLLRGEKDGLATPVAENLSLQDLQTRLKEVFNTSN
ncbi:sulfite reductase beta subunit-like hemoprotein [Geothermobacter ehrlichii]|uniref:Sulfite reductase beta subunit-like hemoprotein n=1 Tax=Geothermobacter ehrlichii TaxID=213224 RepID=A0A5D3WKS2_9BACT|nr:nitrite/sulfite reductase [Geothermobacter ehrlichii]TYO98536.1 sulfite reductase beta subunit-like hemoprotein [Geothermobacter ehrlichii]